MRRFGFIAVATLALLAIAAPVVDARNGSARTPKTPTFVAKTNTAVQGGALRIVAKVKHPQKGAAFAATATVHFASGDVNVPLKRHGKSFNAGGTAPVGDTETAGAVPVDVTFTYNGAEEVVETEGTIESDEDDEDQDEDDDDDDQDASTCDPATTACDDDGDDDGGDDGSGPIAGS